MPTSKAMELVAITKPPTKIDQVWRVWEDLQVFREHRLNYSQIADLLTAHYEITITPRQLKRVSYTLRRRVRSGLEPPRVLESSPAKPPRTEEKSGRPDPFEQLRERERAARADDRKVDDVFKTRRVSDLTRKDGK